MGLSSPDATKFFENNLLNVLQIQKVLLPLQKKQ
jgi:hypothetical protein